METGDLEYEGETFSFTAINEGLGIHQENLKKVLSQKHIAKSSQRLDVIGEEKHLFSDLPKENVFKLDIQNNANSMLNQNLTSNFLEDAGKEVTQSSNQNDLPHYKKASFQKSSLAYSIDLICSLAFVLVVFYCFYYIGVKNITRLPLISASGFFLAEKELFGVLFLNVFLLYLLFSRQTIGQSLAGVVYLKKTGDQYSFRDISLWGKFICILGDIFSLITLGVFISLHSSSRFSGHGLMSVENDK